MNRPKERARELSGHFHAIREKLHSVDRGNANAAGALNFTEVNLLFGVGMKGAMTMGEIARTLQMTLSGVTTVVDKLEHKGFVRRARSAIDRRVVHVELTERGLKCYGDLEKGHLKLTGAILALLDNSEQDQLLVLFRKITNGLEKGAKNA